MDCAAVIASMADIRPCRRSLPDNCAYGVGVSRRGGPWRFLGWVAGVSLPFFVLGAVGGEVGIGSMRLPASAVMVVVPGAVAVGLCWREGGGAAVAGLLRRLVDRPRPPWRWYVLAAGVFPAVSVLAQAVAEQARGAPASPPLPLVMVPAVAVVFVLAAACEELGWTAYATAPLLERAGVVGTGVVLGLSWAVWHLIPLLQAGHPPSWIVGWVVTTVAARMIIVAVYVRTGAVGTAITAHAMLNLAQSCTPALNAPVTMAVSAAAVAAVAAALIARHLVPTGDGSRHRRPRPW